MRMILQLHRVRTLPPMTNGNVCWALSRIPAMLAVFGCMLPALLRASARAEELPGSDLRATALRDLNTKRAFPQISAKSEWAARAKEIREQILVSCGLWPIPEKTPLQPQVVGKI